MMAKLPETIDYGFVRLHLTDCGLSKSDKPHTVGWNIEVKTDKRLIRWFAFKWSYRIFCCITKLCRVPFSFVADMFEQKAYLEDVKNGK